MFFFVVYELICSKTVIINCVRTIRHVLDVLNRTELLKCYIYSSSSLSKLIVEVHCKFDDIFNVAFSY